MDIRRLVKSGLQRTQCYHRRQLGWPDEPRLSVSACPDFDNGHAKSSCQPGAVCLGFSPGLSGLVQGLRLRGLRVDLLVYGIGGEGQEECCCHWK